MIWFVLAYFIGILLLARIFSRKITDLTDYFLAGRSLGALPVAITFTASWFGAGSIIASLNAYNQHGVSGLWEVALPSLITCFLITFFMAQRVSRQNMLSQPDAVGKHYGEPGRFLLALIILTAVTAFVGSQLAAVGVIFETTLNLDVTWSTLLVIGAVVTYAMLGGYFAVVVTDMAQISLVTLTLIALLVFCVMHAFPLEGFQVGLPLAHFQNQSPHFWDMGFNVVHNLFLTLAFVLGWVIAPEMWQRMSSTRNDKLAFKAALGAAGFLFILYMLVLVIGLLSGIVLGKSSDRVLVDLALKMDHPLWSAFILAGVTSAISSTMDSSINVGSLTLTHDLYQRFFRPDASTRELLWVSRAGTIIVALPAVAIALYFQDIIRILWISADIYASTMFIPIMALLYMEEPGRWSGILAMLFGGATVLINALNQYGIFNMPDVWPEWPYSTVLGVTMSALGFGLGCLFSKKVPIKPIVGHLPAFDSPSLPLDGDP